MFWLLLFARLWAQTRLASIERWTLNVECWSNTETLDPLHVLLPSFLTNLPSCVCTLYSTFILCLLMWSVNAVRYRTVHTCTSTVFSWSCSPAQSRPCVLRLRCDRLIRSRPIHDFTMSGPIVFVTAQCHVTLKNARRSLKFLVWVLAWELTI